MSYHSLPAYDSLSEDEPPAPASPTPVRPPSTTSSEPQLSTYAGIIHAFTDLLEVSIHTILHTRHLYPSSLFLPTRKYNSPVYQSRAPRLNEYIRHVVTECGEHLLSGTPSKIVLTIFSASAIPLERYIFDFSSLPVVPRHKQQSLLIHEGAEEGLGEAELREQFRALVTTLGVVPGKLGALPEGCRWGVAVEMRGEADERWVLGEKGGRGGRGGGRLLPVRGVECGAIGMGVWVEEGVAKGKLKE